MVFQEPVLLRRSVEANIDYALRKRGFKAKDRSRKLEAILRETNLLKLRKRPASVLSSGERQTRRPMSRAGGRTRTRFSR